MDICRSLPKKDVSGEGAVDAQIQSRALSWHAAGDRGRCLCERCAPRSTSVAARAAGFLGAVFRGGLDRGSVFAARVYAPYGMDVAQAVRQVTRSRVARYSAWPHAICICKVAAAAVWDSAQN